MKKINLLLLLIILLFNSYIISAQERKSFNLDFEEVEKNQPVGWSSRENKNYTAALDSSIFHKGKYSISIAYKDGDSNFRAWGYRIPAKYEGSTIKLEGYIKTENVTDGYAGFWLRIDPIVGVASMANRGVTGTKNWKKYEVEAKLKPSQGREIVFGGLLTGKGKAWFDNLSITIDGIPIEKAKLRKISPAEKDKEFDSGSLVNIANLNEQKVINLELLGKIWGFLKYHHPAVKKGNYNWDYELFRILPKMMNTINDKQRDELIVKWIQSLGSLKKCDDCIGVKEGSFLKPNKIWIDLNNISPALKSELIKVYESRGKNTSYYIDMFPFVGNPEFKNENTYFSMPYPDDGYRLLSLYRYWNAINYFFPNIHLMDKDWNIILKEYIPKFINAKNELEYKLVLLKIIGDIQDTHANLLGGVAKINEWKGNLYPPFHVQFIENKLVITDYYNDEYRAVIGLSEGDIITEINGVSVADIIKDKLPYYPASNYSSQLRDLSHDILRSNEESIKLKYIKDGKTGQKIIDLYKKDDLNTYRWYPINNKEKSYKIIDGNIGYITLKNIQQEDVIEIKKQLKKTKGIIIDIRNYPATFVVFSLGSFFTSEPRSFVKFSRGSTNNPGEFIITEGLKVGQTTTNYYKNKVVVLVNELTQSQAEYTTIAFRAGVNTTVIGSTTAGADGNISVIPLPGNVYTHISGIGVYYPDGTETQRVGIIPDIRVKPTIKGIKQGRDEVLEKAIEIINNQ